MGFFFSFCLGDWRGRSERDFKFLHLAGVETWLPGEEGAWGEGCTFQSKATPRALGIFFLYITESHASKNVLNGALHIIIYMAARSGPGDIGIYRCV